MMQEMIWVWDMEMPGEYVDGLQETGRPGRGNEADKVSLLLDGLCDSPVIFGCEWEIRHTKGYPSDNQAITKR